MRTRSFCIMLIGLTLLCAHALAQENKNAALASATVTDVDGNVYKSVTIGNQVWMAEDLKTTRYRNGDLIGTTSPSTLDISSEGTPKYQWAYAGDESNVATYGRLYTWYAATDSRSVCPVGWHVPSDTESGTLIDFLGGEEAAQGKLKEAGTTHWHSPNTDATNESGFTALPGGNRWVYGRFFGIGNFTHWWTATEYDSESAWRRVLSKDAPADHFQGWSGKKVGWLVRCVKDAPALSSASSAASSGETRLPVQPETHTAPASLTITDIDGNVYKSVTIGDQVWMASDLKTTRYRNGDLIGTTSPAILDISSENAPKYQWAYEGDESNVATYGRLYTWYAATDSRNVCPAGWHLPSNAEWQTLIDFLGGEKAAQGKLKEAGTTHWNSPNDDATNESGFTALPGGNRFNNEPFAGLGYGSHWWTATEYDAKFAWRRIMVNITPSPEDESGGWADKKIGWHVRCIQDTATLPLASLAAMESANAVSPGAPQRPPLDVTYIANEGFLIQAGGKKVLVDALFNGPTNYLVPSPELLAQMTAGNGPFADVDLLLVTHTHSDHFNAKLVIEFLRHHARCRLVAHTQVVDLLRKEDGFAQIEGQIHEVKLEPGAYEHVSLNEINIDALCLKHMSDDPEKEPTRNLTFIVALGGVRFLHLGDSLIIQSEAGLKNYPFEQKPVDLLFLNQYDRTHTTQKFIAETIKPSQIVAMHIPPAKLAEETDKILTFFPHAIIFKQSMERRSIPIEVDFHKLTGEYLGQTPPGATPQVFALGIISTDANEHSAPSFSPDGNEVFWWANRWPDHGPPMSMTMRRENGLWSAPWVSQFGNMPAFSPDGRRVYFFAPRPGSDAAQGTESALDIWFAEKQGDGWSAPKCLNLVVRYPELRYADMPRVTRNGTLYFLGYAPDTKSNHGIYRSELINGEYAKPELLPRSINLPSFLNWAPFIAPDESYLLFSSNRTGSLDEYGDLYISRRQPDGSWTDPVSLGEPVNTPMQEVFPGVSPDGKYLFFCRDTPGHKNDVYWVDAASIPALRSISTSSHENPK